MRLFPIAMVVLMAALSGGEEELFGSTNFLRSFIARKKLDEQHVGVAFNILTGLPYHLTLFSDPEYDIDPFSAKSRFEIRQLRTARDVQEIAAFDMHVDYVRGMFVKKQPPPLHVPPKSSGMCFLSSRTDILLVVKIRARSLQTLDPSFLQAIRSLPHEYNVNDTLPWTDFLSVFPTHFTESAIIGGKISVSSSTESAHLKEGHVREAIDELLHNGETQMADFVKSTKERITVRGGSSSFLGGSFARFNHQQHSAWLESVKQAPAVVGYNVRPISDLIDDIKLKIALSEAIRVHLKEAYEQWRKAQVLHDEVISLLETKKNSLHSQVQELELKRITVAKRLEQAVENIRLCEKETLKTVETTKKCRAEILAYQKSVLSCDQRNQGLDQVFDELYACEAKKKISGCVQSL